MLLTPKLKLVPRPKYPTFKVMELLQNKLNELRLKSKKLFKEK